MSDPTDEARHQALRESLGAYLLGHLPAAEVPALEEHLADCADCTAEYVELAPVAAALAEVRSGEAESPVGPAEQLSPPADLEATVLAAVGAEQRRTSRRSWTRTAAVAGLAAVAASVVTVVGLRLTAPDEPVVPLEPVAIASEAPGIDASADLVAHTWGVEVKLRATGFAAGERYVVAVTSDSGREFPAGEFVGTGPAEMVCNLNSSVLRDRADGFEVRDRDGDVVLVSRF